MLGETRKPILHLPPTTQQGRARKSKFLSLVVCQFCLSAFGAEGQLTELSAGDLRLTLAQSATGVTVQSLLDTRWSQELLAANPLPLFSLTLRQVGSTNWVTLNANAGWRQCRIQPHGQRLELRWSEPLDPAWAGLGVVMTVSADRPAEAFRWNLRINNPGTKTTLGRVRFPQLALANLGTNGAVLFPRGPGEEQCGVWDRPFTYQSKYPSGWASMQFMAAYRPGPNPTGLYVGMHDPWGSAKDLAVQSDPAEHVVRLTFDHPAPGMGLAGNGFVLEGEAVWQLLRGDWFDAASLYKAWAQRHAKWWPSLGREGRSDTPLWMRQLNLWTQARGAAADCVPAVEAFRQFMGQPVGFHWYNWHQIPFDNDYPHYFPVTPGFADGVAQLKADGVFPMPYINGRLWDSHDRGAEDFEFSRLALAAATKQEDGSPFLEKYNSKETNGQPVRLGVMCPTTPLWQNTLSNIVLRLLREDGTSGVYIDQVAAMEPALCLDPTHGHPLGGGHWWNEGYWKMFKNIRRAMPPGTILTTECNAEPFLREFDGYLTWHWQNQGMRPAFSAVYGGAIQMFGRSYRGGATKDLALRMKAGQQLVFGEQLGWMGPNVLQDQDNAQFLRQLVQLRAKFNRYFWAGQMARPPKLLGQVPTVRADWQWEGEQWVSTDAVLTGAWQLPREKRLVLWFVNISDQPVPAQWHFDAAALGIRAHTLKAQRSTASQTESDWQTWPAACDRSTVLPPQQAEAWELRW